jgi:hypothetical protein
MTSQTDITAIDEVLRLIDLYADENFSMGTDSIMHPVRLMPYRKHEARQFTAEEEALSQKLMLDSAFHCVKYHAAKDIALLIRQHFGLPAREEI